MDKTSFYAIIFIIAVTSLYSFVKYGLGDPIAQNYIGMSVSTPFENNLSNFIPVENQAIYNL